MNNPEIVAAIVSAISLIGGAIVWAIKYIAKQGAEMLKEFKPNGGSSLKDQVNRLEERMNEAANIRKEIDAKIDKLYEIIINMGRK